MKVIIRDRLNRPTEPDRLFILHVPEREGRIIVDALNKHAIAYDSYECVEDGYRLYRPHECSKEYFIALSAIWAKWFAGRKGGEPFTMLQRDKEIEWLQTRWKTGTKTGTETGSNPQTVAHSKPQIILKLGGTSGRD